MMTETTQRHTAVVVTAHHPTLGPLYWYFFNEASVTSPDFYGITDTVQTALLLDKDWRDAAHFSRHSQHIALVLAELDSDPSHSCINGLNRKAGESIDEFREWMRSADWIDAAIPVPVVKHATISQWEALPNERPQAARWQKHSGHPLSWGPSTGYDNDRHA